MHSPKFMDGHAERTSKICPDLGDFSRQRQILANTVAESTHVPPCPTMSHLLPKWLFSFEPGCRTPKFCFLFSVICHTLALWGQLREQPYKITPTHTTGTDRNKLQHLKHEAEAWLQHHRNSMPNNRINRVRQQGQMMNVAVKHRTCSGVTAMHLLPRNLWSV